MQKNNLFVDDYSLRNAKVVRSRGLKLSEPERFAKKYGSEKSYEALSLDIWQDLIKEGGVVCDVGAHHGIYSLVAAKTGRTKAIYAYEPVTENVAILENNIRLNDFHSKITVRNAALSDHVGTAEFQITEASDNANFRGHPNSPTIRKDEVRTSTLDADFQSSKLDLIKIDTDGFEPYILKGANDCFKRNPQLIMLIEFNPKCLRQNGFKPLGYLETLKQFGFELYLIDDLNDKISYITNRKDIWREIELTKSYYNILCLPASQVIFEPLIRKHDHSDRYIDELERRVSSLETSLKEAEHKKSTAEARLNRIHNTRFWRYIVRPLRKFLRRV